MNNNKKTEKEIFDSNRLKLINKLKFCNYLIDTCDETKRNNQIIECICDYLDQKMDLLNTLKEEQIDELFKLMPVDITDIDANFDREISKFYKEFVK